MPAVKKGKKGKKTKRRLKKPVIIAIVAVFLLVYIFLNVPGMLTSDKLAKLGYDKEAISAIKKQKLTDEILDNEWYSKQLNDVIKHEGFRKELIPLYLATENLNQDDLRLYDKLTATYTAEQVVNCFTQLKFYEMTPLLVFDKIEDISLYIEDVKNHRAVNSQDHFELAGTYYVPYNSTLPVINEGSIDMLVNKRYYLSSAFAPATLTDMSVKYAAKGIQMQQEAYDAFKSMCDSLISQNMSMYASSTYRDYAYQENLYASYEKKDGVEKADTYAARPGHSEHQTGLTADMASATGGLAKFGDTQEFQWMLANAHNYGWILRYPEGKEMITGYEAEPWHWRYVGVDLAIKVYNSKLTYDEYYMLYLQ